ncbi:uncharacterized protein LOC111686989 [Lucilia cuprina]|nr:uncharacterized protein LOC111686989 [Lucilia cuprina]KAI8127576.1 hypothetical protein CVS40_2999 [Lucilia cuprina]
MKTLFGIRSNIAVIAVGSIYLIISLNISINGLNKYKEFLSDEHTPYSSLLLNTDTNFFHIFTLILSLSCLLASLLLILGVVEKRHSILQPWLIVNCTLEVILTSGLFYLLYLLTKVFYSSWSNVCGILLAITINAIVVAFHDYLRNGIYYLYKTFQRESTRLYRVIDNEANDSIDIV